MGFFDRIFNSTNNSEVQKQQRNSNSLDAVLQRCRKYKSDTIVMFTSKNCPYCSKFSLTKNGNRRIYSISGKSKKYKPLSTIPADLTIGRCPECDKAISFGIYTPGINSF